MILEELSYQEYELMNQISQLTNQKDSIELKIKELKIPESYIEIHKKYSNSDYEGLKRAIFLQWYAVIELMCNTGIGTIDSEEEKRNMLKLNNLVLEGKLDKEFQTMISYYYSIANWYFESFNGIDILLNYLKSNNESEQQFRNLNIMTNRGQMGEYWNSIKKE